MGFPISTIGTDSGLNWETNLNAALTTIDQHNHSAGQGQQIQPNGINISSDLSFGSNNATNLRTTRFIPQSVPISNTGADVGEVYVSGNELFYNDVSGGNQVQITTNGNVNATSSGISSGTASASFSAGILNVKSSSTSFGSVAMLSAILSNSGNLVNQLTLQAPALSTSIVETLPPIPASQSFMAIDVSGNMTGFAPVSGGITGSMIAPTTVAKSNQVAVGQQISSSSGTYSITGSGPHTVTNLNVSITTSGRPVMVFLTHSGAGGTNGVVQVGPSGNATSLVIQRNASTIYQTILQPFSDSGLAANVLMTLPSSSFMTIDPVAAGTYAYTVIVAPGVGTDTINVFNTVLVAYEL